MIEDDKALKNGIKIETTDEAADFGVAVYFDYIEDETSAVEASITDNYVESNYSLQDHIAIKPKVYRLKGCVGEVVYQNKFEFMDKIYDKIYHPVLEKTINAMKPITAIAPTIGNYTQTAINVVNQVESSFKRYKKMVDDFRGKNIYKNKRQETVVAILNQILQQRVPVNLSGLRFNYNPFSEGQYNKIYFLQSVSAHQGDNGFITDIEVTIKEFRIATTKITKIDTKKYGAWQAQKAVNNNEGVAKGQKTDTEATREVLDNIEKNIKNSVKSALKGHPVLYNITKGFYNGIKTVGQIALQGQSFR